MKTSEHDDADRKGSRHDSRCKRWTGCVKIQAITQPKYYKAAAP
jgi:hypothetical protein